jgi:hypothetical protein
MLEQMILGDHEDSENSLKIKIPNALSATQRSGGGQTQQYAPDARQGCMETASLNTGANYKCDVVPDQRALHAKLVSKFTQKYHFSYRLGDRKKTKKTMFFFV